MRRTNRKSWLFVLTLCLLLSLCACGTGGQEISAESEDESAEPKDLFRIGIIQESEDDLWRTVTKSVQRELYVKGKQAGIRFDYKKYTEVADGTRALIDEIGQDFLEAEEVWSNPQSIQREISPERRMSLRSALSCS